MDELRFGSQQSPRHETPIANPLVSPPRNGNRISQQQQQQQISHDPRSSLPRRFTTDSGHVPTLSSMTAMASPPRGHDVSQDYNALHKVQLIEQKKLEYERIREQRRRFEVEMQKLDQQQRREAHELAQMEEEIGRVGGHQSEPTTPPEYRDTSGFPSMFSRPNRYSMSSLASPPGIATRTERSGSQLASPSSGIMQTQFTFEDQTRAQMPSRSVPGTRRNSDDEEREKAVRQDRASHKSTNAVNRYSMPVTRSRNGLNEVFDHANVTRFLFGDDDSSPFFHGNIPDDNFPTLVRREDQMLSASSAALDLALSASPNPEPSLFNGWNSVNRHRPHQSLSSLNGASSSQADSVVNMGSRPHSLRQSLDLGYIAENSPNSSTNIMSPQESHPLATPPRLQSSFSANDIPTVKSTAGPTMNNANNHAQQHFHNHNASMGRIPAGMMTARHTRELSNESNAINREQAPYQSLQSALQASAAPFGPSTTAATPLASAASVTSSTPATAMNSYNGFFPNTSYNPPAPYNSAANNYSMLSANMQQMNMNGVNGSGMYAQQNFNGYPAPAAYNLASQPRDSQARVMQNRRQLDSEAMARYQNVTLDSFRGQIYELCKDQHGCRYLQRKLEERIPEQVHMIWLETNQHVIELMTDPFGNYLCQKLLEFCNDDERTVLIQNAAQDMVRIALNQHGTRALQKMIEFVTVPQQVQIIIEALRFRVVELIQDLNGNHVIQKCLNKLTAIDAQFIFDAVGTHCVDVGTHRHGCCVLQRCIDHASGDQKLWLIQRITEHARTLIQDPFGNYVVQYIIDLNESTFTEPVVEMFRGCICQLSRHKFSSNVIEKCLRCALPPSKDMIVEELLVPQEMERLLRDSYANYVIQTALEYASPHLKFSLVEGIRPLLPQIRSTPYGRRIQAKISAYDNRGSAASSGQVTPADNTQGQIPMRPSHSCGLSGSSAGFPTNGATNGTIAGLAGNQPVALPVSTFPNATVMNVLAPANSMPAQHGATNPGKSNGFHPGRQSGPISESMDNPWL